MLKYEDIEEINKTLPTTDIKGKDYVEVNKRILAFRKLMPNAPIITELLSNQNGVCVFKAKVSDEEGNILATGHAYEREDASFINKTSYIENCETSAVGRALGMLGIGATQSIASAEEIANAIINQEHKNNVSLVCNDCKGAITDYTKKDGSKVPALEVAKGNLDRYGVSLCASCSFKRSK